MPVTINNSVESNIKVEGQETAKALWMAIDYALNNSPTLTAAQKAELEPVRAGLATVFDF